jgi:Bacterial RNA polymerase, alpha chain C terminal domain
MLIDDMPWPARTIHCLQDNNITTTEQICSMRDEELLRLHGFGLISLREVRADLGPAHVVADPIGYVDLSRVSSGHLLAELGRRVARGERSGIASLEISKPEVEVVYAWGDRPPVLHNNGEVTSA